jgi:hypothetical protein
LPLQVLKSPGDKKQLEKKKGHKNHPKKRARALPDVKKKIGVEQEKVGRVRWANK